MSTNLKRNVLTAYYLVMGVFLSLFLFMFMYSVVEKEKFNAVALGRMGYLTYNGIIFTVCTLFSYVICRLFERYFLLIKILFTISFMLESIVSLEYWVLFFWNDNSFNTDENIKRLTKWDTFSDICTHVLPYVILLQIFVLDMGVFCEHYVIMFLVMAIYTVYYFGILYYCNIVKRTPVYLFTANFSTWKLVVLVLISSTVGLLAYLAYYLIYRYRKKEKRIKRANKI